MSWALILTTIIILSGLIALRANKSCTPFSGLRRCARRLWAFSLIERLLICYKICLARGLLESAWPVQLGSLGALHRPFPHDVVDPRGRLRGMIFVKHIIAFQSALTFGPFGWRKSNGSDGGPFYITLYRLIILPAGTRLCAGQARRSNPKPPALAAGPLAASSARVSFGRGPTPRRRRVWRALALPCALEDGQHPLRGDNATALRDFLALALAFQPVDLGQRLPVGRLQFHAPLFAAIIPVGD
jgi:hypothetical protein